MTVFKKIFLHVARNGVKHICVVPTENQKLTNMNLTNFV